MVGWRAARKGGMILLAQDDIEIQKTSSSLCSRQELTVDSAMGWTKQFNAVIARQVWKINR
jgi:hypothetical protein